MSTPSMCWRGVAVNQADTFLVAFEAELSGPMVEKMALWAEKQLDLYAALPEDRPVGAEVDQVAAWLAGPRPADRGVTTM
ncbi:hypothetical protein ACQBAU_17010 [Propionibacteriaceae bacterium Y2011]